MTAPTPAAAPPPLRGSRAQLEVLTRQLLAQHSGLEAIVEAAKGGNVKAAEAMAHALIDQLGAALVVVNMLQLTADTAAAVGTMETPTEQPAGPPQVPNTFGAKRRAEPAPPPIPEARAHEG